ncbi:MAG: aminoacyl-histidine dipeptidase [Clostridia bacterium]|nr:aminoacyl-histidine dipeptidase [Clostridia bacterium]
MNYITEGLSLAGGTSALLRFFEDICKIPHGSGNEQAISDYLMEFARARGLSCYQDEALNVLIVKEATPDCAHKPALLLQGHMDMVCEKNSDVAHDFLTDPIVPYIDGDWMRARGTTLGGDDGIAVAIIMAILDDDTISHPKLECLITTGEETRMEGAGRFDYSRITARRLINLDSEDEGVATASCAGGMDLMYTLPTDRISCPGRPIKITVKGLAGGHSGADIHLCRGNANRILGRLLAVLYEDTPFNLVTVSGGNKRNAIPREAVAEIFVDDPKAATAILLAEEAKLKKELSDADAGFKLLVGKGAPADAMLTYKDSSTVINLLTLLPDGVVAMSPFVEGFVRTSSNTGVVTTTSEAVQVAVMARSSSDSEMDALTLTFKRLAKALNVEMVIEDRHAGWDFDPNSKLATDFVEVYKETFGAYSTPVVNAIHAGLECGIIVSALDGECDAISIGPTLRDIHTPDEALYIPSCDRLWTLLLNLMKK